MDNNSFGKNLPPEALNILVVEDDLALLRIVTRWLQSTGAHVRQAQEGSEALAQIEKECPDVLITDWGMPRMNGIELCRAVRQMELLHDPYILFLTAKEEHVSVIEAMAAGADSYLMKPINKREFLSSIWQIQWTVNTTRDQVDPADTDPLTGGLNRRSLDYHLLHEVKRADRYGRPLSCVLMDVDLFKSINDTYGHQVGDAALKIVMKVFIASSRESDIVFRYGGDEFFAILPETDERSAARWAERVRKNIDRVRIPVGKKEIGLKVTVGVAQWCENSDSPSELIDQADEALRVAKQTGRDRVQRYSMLSNMDTMDEASNSVLFSRINVVQACEIMTSPVLCLHQEDSVRLAADFFLRLRINSAPIVDQK